MSAKVSGPATPGRPPRRSGPWTWGGGSSAVVGRVFEVISQVTRDLGLTDFRVVSNCGAQAGQSVPHLHFHVLAGRDMTWPPG